MSIVRPKISVASIKIWSSIVYHGFDYQEFFTYSIQIFMHMKKWIGSQCFELQDDVMGWLKIPDDRIFWK